MGVGQEAMVASAEAKVWHAAAVERARQSHTLLFTWKDLKEVPEDTFKLHDLKELKIGAPQFQRTLVHSTRAPCPCPLPLTVLRACMLDPRSPVGNDIKYVPEELNKLTSLEVLYLHKNRTKFIAPEAFAGLHRLRHISIEDNKIKAMPRSLAHVTSLVDLTISHNRLEHLPAVRSLPSWAVLGWQCACSRDDVCAPCRTLVSTCHACSGCTPHTTALWICPRRWGCSRSCGACGCPTTRYARRWVASVARFFRVSHGHTCEGGCVSRLGLRRLQLTRLPDSLDHLTKLVSLRVNRACASWLAPPRLLHAIASLGTFAFGPTQATNLRRSHAHSPTCGCASSS